MKRGGPLRRRTPLRAHAELSTRQGLRQRGKGQRTRAAELRQQEAYDAVDRRVKQAFGWLACELCGKPLLRPAHHHVAGRGSSAKVAVEMAEGPLMIVAICDGPQSCHAALTDGDLELRDKARWIAYQHLLNDWPEESNDVGEMGIADPLDAIRLVLWRLRDVA